MGKKAKAVWYDGSHMILTIELATGEKYGVRSIDIHRCIKHVTEILVG